MDGVARSRSPLRPVVLGLLFVLTAVGGLCCGLLTRAATLWIAPLSRHPYRFMAVAVVGYILPPVVYSGPAETMAWLKRPSQQVCAAATYRVSAANGARLTADGDAIRMYLRELVASFSAGVSSSPKVIGL